MAFFGLFGKKSSEGTVRKHAERVANKRAQVPDRQESIQLLAGMGTPEAAEALLGRFTIYIDSSITDQEEKEAAFEGIVAVGEGAVEPVRRFMKRAESLSWPLRILDRLLPPGEVIGEILGLLAGMDTEYERDPQRKVQLLAALSERKDPRIVDAVLRFLGDVNETARFHAVEAMLAQDNASDGQVALLETLGREESQRVRIAMLEGCSSKSWPVGEQKRALPTGFKLDAQGVPRRG